MSTVMTPEEFQTWSQRLQLTPETVALITAIRQPPPVRRVKGRVNNVTGRYPSHKMGHSIQFESEHVELWAIYGMERDDDVLEYYDQSSRIPLSYRAKSGRHTTQWHTPDFFVLRTTSAGWEEWKPALALDDLPFPCLLATSKQAPDNGAAFQKRRMPRSLASTIACVPLRNIIQTRSRISGLMKFPHSQSKKRGFWP